jgi:hypothetical protein
MMKAAISFRWLTCWLAQWLFAGMADWIGQPTFPLAGKS